MILLGYREEEEEEEEDIHDVYLATSELLETVTFTVQEQANGEFLCLSLTRDCADS